MITGKFEQPLKSHKTKNLFSCTLPDVYDGAKIAKNEIPRTCCVNTSGNYFTSDNHWISAQSDIHSVKPYPVQNGLDPSIYSHVIMVFFLA